MTPENRLATGGQIKKQLESKDFRTLKETMSQLHAADIAELFDDLEAGDCVILFRLLHKTQAAEVFSYLTPARRKHIVSSIHKGLLDYILEELYFDDKIDFLEEMPSNFVKEVLAAAPDDEEDLLNEFLHFPENSAGRLVNIEYLDLKKHLTAAQALDRIKAVGEDKESIYTCYVLDDTRRLEGTVSLGRLVLADGEEIVGDLMDGHVILAHTLDDQEEIADLFMKYDLMTLPVVDGEERLIGIITVDDILDVMEQESTEDFQRMAAMAPSDDEYLDTGVFTLAKRRIVWLLVLMVSATFTGAIITRYEELLSTAVMLTAFIPMLMDSGGNAGSQSSTLIIRGMAVGEIQLRDWLRVLWKELRVGLVAGTALAAVNMGRMFLIGHNALGVNLTVSLTLLFTVVIAKLVGGLLPLAAKALRLDPAIMAGPLITTIVDAFSLVVYFGIATMIIL